MDPISWHNHEIVFGFISAAIGGFLLTAVASWTNRPPVTGRRLKVLALLWLAGRMAVSLSLYLNYYVTWAIDSSYLIYLTYLFGNEVVRGKDKRNYKLIGLLVLFLISDLLFFLEITQLIEIPPRFSIRSALMIVLLILLTIAGRIIPNFTRNWIKNHLGDNRKIPPAFNNLDRAVMILTGLFSAIWIFDPFQPVIGGLAIGLGGVHAVRLSRWCGGTTFSDPLLAVLHVGYGWIPISLVLIGLSNFSDQLFLSVTFHGLTIGCISLMIIAVGSRAALGHSGRELKAGKSMTVCYILIFLAAVFRVFASYAQIYRVMLWLAAGCWISGLLIFLVVYWPILTQPSLKKQD